MKALTFEIQGQEVTVKFNFRAELIFEEALSKTFTGKNNSEWIMYFYATLIANTADGFIGFKDFVNWLSENPTVFYDFIEYYTEYQKNIIELREQAKKPKKVKGKKAE